ncbi:hypothetical protein GDO81_019915, partial [Engystomops pustulosus]
MSCRAWRRGQPGPADTILFSLGLCNVLMQSLLICSIVMYFFCFQILISDDFYRLYSGVYIPLCLSSSWMTSWLCIFYCIKITTFQFRFLVWLKSWFSDVLPGLIFMSIVVSFVLIYPITTVLSTGKCSANNTVERSVEFLPLVVPRRFLPIILVWCCIPCLLIFMSLTMTIASLVLHVLRIKGSPSFSDSQITAHVSSMKTMASLLVLYIIFYLSQVILLLNMFPFTSGWFWLFLLLHYSFCTLQGIILTLGNPKLHNALLHFYNFIK